jgi:murein DD-endopeptidase MepM/ murein hydrolase activator NlpD
MSNFKVGKSRFSSFINGKGFYIALALCLIAIGSAAYIAANNSFGNFSNLTTNSDTSSLGTGTSTGGVNWGDGTDAQQTGNIVSGVPGNSSSSVSSKASSAASSKAPSKASSTASVAVAPTLYVLPIEGNIITDYSSQTPIYNKTMDDWRVHDGIDIAGNIGTPVKACADGTVSDVKIDDMLGQEVIIQHGGGVMSVYANLTNQVQVKKGQKVETGEVIGAVGQTATGEISLVPHLHYAMLKNGQYADPLITMGKKK